MNRIFLSAALLCALLSGLISCVKRHLFVPTDPKTSIEILEYNFAKQIKRRGLKKNFNDFQNHLAASFASPAQKNGKEPPQKCRLHFPEQLLSQPAKAISLAEQFTRDLYLSAITANGLDPVLDMIAEKLDVQESETDPQTRPSNQVVHEENDPMQIVIQAIHSTRTALHNAYAPLAPEEFSRLRDKLYDETTGKVQQGYLFADSKEGLAIAGLLEKIDRKQMVQAARSLAILTNPDLIDRLANIPREGIYKMPGVRGEIWKQLETPDGWIIVGGDGPNVYHLDEMPNVCAVIDVGGDDVYIEGSTTAERPLMIILDAAGNDIYRGEKPGIQGGTILGASLLVDRSGNDQYFASDVAQGSALAGIGMLIDYTGDDSYHADRRAQGQALCGIGILIDREGNDRYRAALLSQGVGGPLGFGLLLDENGSDQYYAGGKYPDSYEDSPGFGAWSQGVGVGARGIANGGIGVLLDGGGNDTYQADYFSHGGGYWFGAGFARDFAGDDRRIGATTQNFDGTPRTVQPYLRWGLGFASHYASGFLFDDAGNDFYSGDWATMAYAWDFSVAALVDFRGDDRYVCAGSGLAQSKNVALAVFCDVLGNDSYEGKAFGEAEERAKNFPGSSFAMFFDYLGYDRYPPNLANDRIAVRGWRGGIFMDMQ